MSSLTVVRNYQLQEDEVTALASGVVQAKVVGVPAVRVENGVVHVKVKARIEVDTSVLDRQVQEIMKEKGTLKKLEEERKKNRELEEKLANLKGRLDYQYRENTGNLKAAYAQQRALTTAKLPPEPAPKDAFETTTEYNQRISAYERQVKEAARDAGEAVEMLKKEENWKLAEAKVDYLGQQIRVLAPFVQRLQDLQARKFTLLEGGAMTVDLGVPDADKDRFPVRLQHNGKLLCCKKARRYHKTGKHAYVEALCRVLIMPSVYSNLP